MGDDTRGMVCAMNWALSVQPLLVTANCVASQMRCRIAAEFCGQCMKVSWMWWLAMLALSWVHWGVSNNGKILDASSTSNGLVRRWAMDAKDGVGVLPGRGSGSAMS